MNGLDALSRCSSSIVWLSDRALSIEYQCQVNGLYIRAGDSARVPVMHSAMYMGSQRSIMIS